MTKVAILGDGTGCLPVELVEQYNIHSVPLLIAHQGKTCRDGIDITPSEVYEIMRWREDLPTTSTPSVGDFLNAFHRLSEEAERLKAEIGARFRCIELHVADLTPAMGVHTGPGVLGVAFHTD